MSEHNDIFQQAQHIISAYDARSGDERLKVQDTVMRIQPPEEHWQFVTTKKYALPGRWVWVVLLWCDTGNITPDGLQELRMKAEMVVWDEEEREHYIQSPCDE